MTNELDLNKLKDSISQLERIEQKRYEADPDAPKEDSKLLSIKKRHLQALEKGVDWDQVAFFVDKLDYEFSWEGKNARDNEEREKKAIAKEHEDKVNKTISKNFISDEKCLQQENDFLMSPQDGDSKYVKKLRADIQRLERRLAPLEGEPVLDNTTKRGMEKAISAKKFVLYMALKDGFSDEKLQEESKQYDCLFEKTGPGMQRIYSEKEKEKLKKECLKFISQLMPKLV